MSTVDRSRSKAQPPSNHVWAQDSDALYGEKSEAPCLSIIAVLNKKELEITMAAWRRSIILKQPFANAYSKLPNVRHKQWERTYFKT